MDLVRNLAYTLRSLARSKGYSLAFILTLGLGIGANTAVFSVVRGILLKPIPHRGGDRLVHIRQGGVAHAIPDATWSVPEIHDYRASSKTLVGFGEFSALTFTMLGHDEPSRVRAGIVSGDYFDVLGLRPVLGRLMSASDDGKTADPVMVLTHDFWQRRFGGDISVTEKTVRMNGRTLAIVGVLEPVPHYPERTDVFVNMVTSPHHMSAAMSDDRLHRMTQLFGRLTPGETIERASAEMEAIAGRLALEYPESYELTEEPRIAMTPLVDELVFRARPMLLVLMAASAFVLLIACANVTNLTLTRALSRGRELSMRAAMGASRSRLRWLLLRENLMLSVAGAALGLLLTGALRDLLVAVAARYTSRAMEIEIDAVVFASTLIAAAGTAVVSALAPRLPRPGTAGNAVRATSGAGQRALQRALVVTQISAAFVLLAGAGLFARTLLNLSNVDPGYATESVLTMEIPVSRGGRTQAQIVDFYQRVTTGVGALPGVRAAAVASTLPLGGEPILLEVSVDGYQPDPRASALRADYRAVSPDYFEVIGVALSKGRPFTSADDAAAAKVVIINQSMASFYFGDRDPTGRRLRWSDKQLKFIGIDDGWRTIVGVAPDTKDYSLDADPPHVVYQPFAQEPWPGSFLARTAGEPIAVGRAAAAIIRTLDGEQPIENVRTLDEIRAATIAPRRLNTALVSSFALLSLAIAAVGVFGVLGFSVSRRTKEFGIRSSLGADARSLQRMVLSEGMSLGAAGLVVGAVVALLMSRFLRGFLFGIEPFDPGTLAIVAIVLGGVAATASWLPAWRASRVAPVDVLRMDQ